MFKANRFVLVIVLLTLGALAVALTPLVAPGTRLAREWGPKPGLDIQGGVRVVLEAETNTLPPDQRAAILGIIENRVNANGVAEPSITPKGEKQFVVEIPSIRNRDEVLQQLQNTARLEFYYSPDWKTQRNQIGRYEIVQPEPEGPSSRYQITDTQTSDTFRDPYQINLALKQLIDAGAKATQNTTDVTVPESMRRLAAAAGGEKPIRLTQTDAKQIAALEQEMANFNRFLGQARLELTGNDLRPTAQSQFESAGGARPVVAIEFNPEGGRKFGQFTRDHVNEILMIYLDGRILSAPNIEGPITGGQATISGFATLPEAQQLADLLNGGALPVPLRVVQQQSIEATLGRDAVRAGLTAGLAGLTAVLLFMMYYYLLPGAVACVALLLYTLFTYAVFVIIPVTFTLPGIAGFILSVGMAVDANVLIFERTKEELRAGKTLRAAIETGFARAFSAILDSNVCTAITSILLYNFGSGPVRGFALTLLIGVAISMFTAITVTRTLLLLLVNTKTGRNLDAWGINRTFVPRLDVVGKRNAWFLFSGLLIVPGLIAALAGGFKPGIDFTGGSELTLGFTRPVTRDEVEQVVTAQGVEDPVVQIAEGTAGGNTVFVRLPGTGTRADAARQQANTLVSALNTRFPQVTEQGFESIGSSISSELTRNAFLSVFFSSILIVLYLAFRFAIGGLANGLKFGLCAIVAMLHDVFVLIGAFAILGYFLNWKVDSLFVTAALTVIGFSVHDTIVIFDRIRENLRGRARGESFEALINKSINETFTRSVNTSVTVLLTLLALLLLGGPVIRPLNVALFIGILSGTYSSIFNAAPLLVVLERVFGGRGAVIASTGGGRPGAPQVAAAGGGGRTSIPPLRPTAPAPDQAPTRLADGARVYGTDGNGAGGGPDDSRPRPNVPPGQRRKRRM